MAERATAGDARRSVGLDRALLIAAVLVPACLAASRAMAVPDAAHDAGVIRVVGLGWAGGLRALDAAAAAPFLAVPLGTRALRAALASAAATGIAGGLLYVLVRGLLARAADTRLLNSLVACVASLSTTLSIAWQLESSVAAGATVGALIALVPIALVADLVRVEDEQLASVYCARIPLVGLATAVALGYEQVVGLAALLGVSAVLVTTAHRAPPGTMVTDRRTLARITLAVGAGLLPVALPFARRATSTIELDTRPLATWLGEGALGPSALAVTSPLPFLHLQVGWLALFLAGAGLVIAALIPRARALALALVALGAVGLGAIGMGAPASATRHGAGALLALAAVYALAAVAMQAVVRGVANAPVPFASASAAMIVVLEIAFPAVALDDSAAACDARARAAYAGFDEAFASSVPPASVMLLRDGAVVRHLMAGRALGTLRGDVALVPVHDLGGRAARHELSKEAALAPFFRDLALAGAPSEFSLASLAGGRPVILEYQVTWDRALARHLVPAGVFDRFEPEPRGVSDRRKALEAFLPDRERLARALPPPRDPVLPSIVAAVLRARMLALTAANERDLVPRAIDDLRAFEPADPTANELVRRLVTTKGPIDVKDL
jgi:hypothetical protein